MDFAFTPEQELLRKTVRDFLAERIPMKEVRAVMEDGRGYAPAVWEEMAKLGWTGLIIPEEYGGAELGYVDLVPVLEEMGRALTPVPYLPTQLAAAALVEGGTADQKREWLPRIADGSVIATLAIAEEPGSEEPAALSLEARSTADGFELSGVKLFVPDAQIADLILVVARSGGGSGESGLSIFLVPSDTKGVSVELQNSIDPLRRLCEVHFQNVRVPASAQLGGDADAWPTIRRILDRGLVMLAAEMVGGAEQCLEASVAYAKERVQFGKPIGVNQAIKHKCADMLFEVESSKSITYYAAWAATEANDEAPITAAMAKAYTSDAFRHASAENIQIHGGVGFTWEYDCHLYFKRAKTDEVWLGDARLHRERVAEMLDI